MAANDSKVRDSVRYINNDNDFLLKTLIWNNPEVITQPMATGDLLLHYAVKQGKLKAVSVLLGRDALGENDTFVRVFNFFGWWLHPQNNVNDINLANKEGRTPLHYAALQGNVEIAKILLENGADVNVADKDTDPETALAFRGNEGKAPLHYAVENGHVEVARLLLQKGANVNLKDEDGCTPLYEAVFKGDVIIAKFLLENGADIEAKDNRGRTPLGISRSNEVRNRLKTTVLAGLWEMSSTEYASLYQWLPREVADDIAALVETKPHL